MKKIALITFLIVLLDQVIKIYVKTNMYIGQQGIDIWILGTEFTENPGMAFGAVIPVKYGKLVLSLLRIGAIIAIILYLKKLILQKAPVGFLVALACVLAGAIGNVIDGMFYGLIFSESTRMTVAEFMPEGGGYAPFLMGSVVDMLKFNVTLPEWFPFWSGRSAFPFIFNVADASITVGISIILLRYRSFFKKAEVTANSVGEEE